MKMIRGVTSSGRICAGVTCVYVKSISGLLRGHLGHPMHLHKNTGGREAGGHSHT